MPALRTRAPDSSAPERPSLKPTFSLIRFSASVPGRARAAGSSRSAPARRPRSLSMPMFQLAVLALVVDRRRDVERLAEALEARPDQERVVGHVRGLDPGLVHVLREEPLVGRDRAPARELRQLGRDLPVAERERARAGEERAPHRDGRHRLGHGAVEAEALLGERVEVRGVGELVAVVGAHEVAARAVGDDQEDVQRLALARHDLLHARLVGAVGVAQVTAGGGQRGGARGARARIADEVAPREALSAGRAQAGAL